MYNTKHTKLSNMPNTTQNVIDSSITLENPITSELLRVRANSSSKKKSTNNSSMSRLSGSEYEFESFTGGMPSVENRWIDKRELSHR